MASAIWGPNALRNQTIGVLWFEFPHLMMKTRLTFHLLLNGYWQESDAPQGISKASDKSHTHHTHCARDIMRPSGWY